METFMPSYPTNDGVPVRRDVVGAGPTSHIASVSKGRHAARDHLIDSLHMAHIHRVGESLLWVRDWLTMIAGADKDNVADFWAEINLIRCR